MFWERDPPWKSRLLPISHVLEMQCLPAWPRSHLWEGQYHPCTDTSRGVLHGLLSLFTLLTCNHFVTCFVLAELYRVVRLHLTSLRINFNFQEPPIKKNFKKCLRLPATAGVGDMFISCSQRARAESWHRPPWVNGPRADDDRNFIIAVHQLLELCACN